MRPGLWYPSGAFLSHDSVTWLHADGPSVTELDRPFVPYYTILPPATSCPSVLRACPDNWSVGCLGSQAICDHEAAGTLDRC